MSEMYSINLKKSNGEELKLNEYKDKVLLVVNTASKCGFTPQFEGLQALYDEYKSQGLEILGFPCDQFAHQEPGDNDEIVTFCQRNYGVNFSMFSKTDVNGENAHDLYKLLKKELPGMIGESIKWNFTKFLINRDGKPVKRFAPTTKPESLKKQIEELL